MCEYPFSALLTSDESRDRPARWRPSYRGPSQIRQSGAVSQPAESEEHEEPPLHLDQRGSLQPPDPLPHVAASNGRDLVNHQEAVLVEPVLLGRLDPDEQQRRVDVIAGERAHGHRISPVEPVVLNYQRGPRFARVDATGDCDEVSAPHVSQSSETASTKSMSSSARSPSATRTD